jgi:DNA-binding MarR family transcriptional regulator
MTSFDLQKSLETASTELSLAIGQLRRRLRTEANPNELNLAEMGALSRLEKVGWMTTADLARAEAMRPQSMGTILTGLKQKGLVQRRPHPTDGRQIEFALTSTGMEAKQERRVAKREWLLAAMAKLTSEEQKILIDAIALIKRLGEE